MESPRLIRAAMTICVVMLFAATARAATVPAVEKLLPAKGEVAKFGILADSLTYGKGADISKIYDGGYEVYTKHGVIDAARQMYQRDKDYVEITVHTMKNQKAALDFLKYWAKERGGKVLMWKPYSLFIVEKPNVMGYYAIGKYFVTITAYYPPNRPSSNVKQDLNDFAMCVQESVVAGLRAGLGDHGESPLR